MNMMVQYDTFCDWKDADISLMLDENGKEINMDSTESK